MTTNLPAVISRRTLLAQGVKGASSGLILPSLVGLTALGITEQAHAAIFMGTDYQQEATRFYSDRRTTAYSAGPGKDRFLVTWIYGNLIRVENTTRQQTVAYYDRNHRRLALGVPGDFYNLPSGATKTRTGEWISWVPRVGVMLYTLYGVTHARCWFRDNGGTWQKSDIQLVNSASWTAYQSFRAAAEGLNAAYQNGGFFSIAAVGAVGTIVYNALIGNNSYYTGFAGLVIGGAGILSAINAVYYKIGSMSAAFYRVDSMV